jgi:hypothetical protein
MHSELTSPSVSLLPARWDSGHRRLGARLARSGACLLTLLGAMGVARAATVYDKDNVQLELYGILEVGLGP